MTTTRSNLARYGVSLAIVLGVHVLAVLLTLNWSVPQAVELPPAAMMVELAPLPAPAPPPPPKAAPQPPAPVEEPPLPKLVEAPKPKIAIAKPPKPKAKPQPPKPEKNLSCRRICHRPRNRSRTRRPATRHRRNRRHQRRASRPIAMRCRRGRATCCATWPSTSGIRKTLAAVVCKASTGCASW